MPLNLMTSPDIENANNHICFRKVLNFFYRTNNEAQLMLMAILKELHKTSSAIEASWIVSADGLALASVAPADTDEDRAAAICCGVLSVAQHAVKDLARGVLEKVSLISDRGCVLLANAGQESVLAVLTQPGAELDSVFLDVERAAAKCKILPADNRPLKNPRISFERTGSLLQP